ncbi:LysM peptidoglycan-binding domain-containing protein [Anoxybacterium hadale]|uniref:LysM peptidoglycan-binding domain-containing protein n=1 Tax=Anoxybacterium hadale TaxID=3408580 RepID=A0ACD1AB29_9FIRM|nr:LysM peptidoglycan-binding domain-containing protein [Clostridiales bacterium]
MRKFIFREPDTSKEIVLPVTPGSFNVSHGVKIETINIHGLGDINLAGYGTLCAFKIDCMFPSKHYPFIQNLMYSDPYKYIQELEVWCDARKVIRFIVSDTMVNVPVLIEDIAYGERDGTRDVYASISLRKYRTLAANIDPSVGTQNNAREPAAAHPTPNEHKVASGDTLSAICKKYYGNASLYPKLAKYNNIKNPNLIYTGQSIKIPDKSLLV